MITCDKATKTSNSLICCNAMFHMLHDFVVILYLSHYYHVAMFQDIRNSDCIHMLHHYYSQHSSRKHTQLENVAYACFSNKGMMR